MSSLALRFIVMRYTNITRRSVVSLRAVVAVAGVAVWAMPAFATPREVGIWYDDTGKGAVKIEVCTPTTLCGKIYWLKEPLTAQGQPKIDRYNPEPTMRKRSICGLPVLGNLEQLSDGGFDNGWVYDPKEGKSYSVALELIAPDKLQVTGYKGMKFLGKSFIWTRAPDDLPACTSDTAAVPGKSSEEVASTKAAMPPAAKLDASKTASKTAVPTHKKTKKAARAAATPQPPVASN